MEEFVDWLFRGLVTIATMGLGWLLLWQRAVERNITLLKERVEHHSSDIKSINDLPTSEAVNEIRERVARIETAVETADISGEIKGLRERVDALAKDMHTQVGQNEQMNRTLGMIHNKMMKD